MEYVDHLKYLTESEWRELVALEYVLTWNYTENREADESRYSYLSNKRWYGTN